MRCRSIIAICVLAVFLVGCTGESPQSEWGERAYPVVLSKVVQKDVPLFVEAIGNIASPHVVEVKSQVDGVILDTHVSSGQLVKQGDLLLMIDPREYEAALEKAVASLEKNIANLQLSREKVERYSRLVEDDFVSKQTYKEFLTEVETGEAEVSVGKAEVELAKIKLAYCEIYAPIDGRLGSIKIDPGNYISASDGTVLMRIRQMDPIHVAFAIPQNVFLKAQPDLFKEGVPIEVILAGIHGTRMREGKVIFVDGEVNMETGTIRLKGTLDNPDELFWPGEFVRVRMLTGNKPGALLVPLPALQVGQKGPYVYTVEEDDTATLHQVKVGERIGKWVVIDNGLKPGDRVVIDGQINLRPGLKVLVQEEEPPTME